MLFRYSVCYLLSIEFLYPSNDLSDMDQVGYLSLCSALSVLTLEGNPLCTLLAEQQVRLRSAQTLFLCACNECVVIVGTSSHRLGDQRSYQDE